MRKCMETVALVAGLGIAAPLWAQGGGLLTGVNPTQLTFTPINTTQNLAAPLPTMPQQTSSFSIWNFFPTWALPSFLLPTKTTTSAYPSPSSFPSTSYRSPIQPLAPVMPPQQ